MRRAAAAIAAVIVLFLAAAPALAADRTQVVPDGMDAVLVPADAGWQCFPPATSVADQQAAAAEAAAFAPRPSVIYVIDATEDPRWNVDAAVELWDRSGPFDFVFEDSVEVLPPGAWWVQIVEDQRPDLIAYTRDLGLNHHLMSLPEPALAGLVGGRRAIGQAMVTHELGHVAGLGHTQHNAMNSIVSGLVQYRVLGTYNRALIERIWSENRPSGQLYTE